MNLDASIEVDVKAGGAWVPVDLFISFDDAKVNPALWREDLFDDLLGRDREFREQQ